MNIDPKLLRSLLVLTTVIEARDHFTGGHVWRVAEYSKSLAKKLGLSRKDILKAYLGGYLHDLGKIGIPDFILNKRESLNEEEYDVIKYHPEIGRQIIKDHPLEYLVVDAISSHHERIDGKGYPKRLYENHIKLIARIVAITDCFDAITSVRPYKKLSSKEKAVEILKKESDGFDSELLATFIDLVEAGGVDSIIGHSDYSRPLLECPKCGPMLAINNNKKDGDSVFCRDCSGIFKLHSNKDFFEIELVEIKDVPQQPDVDYIQIDRLVNETVDLSV